MAENDLSPEIDPIDCIPNGCDVLELHPDRLQALLEKGIDPYVVAISVRKQEHGRWVQHPNVDAIDCSRDNIVRLFGPGRYQFLGKNGTGKFVCSKVTDLGGPDSYHAAHERAEQSHSGQGLGALEQRLLHLALDRFTKPEQESGTSMLKSITEMMVASQQMFQQQMAMQMQLLAAQREPGKEQSGHMMDLVKTLLATKAQPSAGDPMQALQMGLSMGMQLSRGKAGADKDDKFWNETAPEILQQMMPLGLGVLQASMSPEKAKAFADLVRGFMSGDDDDADPLETHGEPIQ